MNEHLFENRIAEVKNGTDEYKPVIFKVASGSYEAGRCYLLTLSELVSFGDSSSLPYIVDYNLKALVDRVRLEKKTVFSQEKLAVILDNCWITLESVIRLKEPVLVDDGHICEKSAITLCQDIRGGFVSSTPLIDPSKKLSVFIPHPIVPLIKDGADLTAIDQTKLPKVEVIKIVTFISFITEAAEHNMQGISPDHPGIVEFQALIGDLRENMPQLLRTKKAQYVFFSSREFRNVWNIQRRTLKAIKWFQGYEKYIGYTDSMILPLLVTAITPSVSSLLVLDLLTKLAVAYAVTAIHPLGSGVDQLCRLFFYPDLSDDGLDLKPFLEAMQKNMAETDGAGHSAAEHPHLA